MTYYTYILTNWNNKVMYIGMTNNLERRLYEHRHHLADGFTSQYNVNKLVYYESTTDVNAAIAREKQFRKYRTMRAAVWRVTFSHPQPANSLTYRQ